MARKTSFRFSETAEKDLEQIIDYTNEQWEPDQALAYIDSLEEYCKNLAQNPSAGLDRHEFAKGLLSFPYQSHIIYYLKDTNGIAVVRVLHQAMDPTKHF